ncbi:hypothetical protein [Symbiopectobacterium sp. RP]|uniref:hypothetical protein n=1 Tax=Symbiopectobacterium sp. RP TaxID=3248553 RepID=UPI003D282787
MITANALICGKKIQLIVIKIMSLGYILRPTRACLSLNVIFFPVVCHDGIKAP